VDNTLNNLIVEDLKIEKKTNIKIETPSNSVSEQKPKT
jgi:hypothetical protein